MQSIVRAYIWMLLLPIAVLRASVPITRAATVEEKLDEINRLPETMRTERLEKEARKEGEVVWYAAMASDRAGELIKAFESKHPYLKVRFQADWLLPEPSFPHAFSGNPERCSDWPSDKNIRG